MHVCQMCLLRIINYQYVSIAVATIVKVTNQNIRDPNNLSKCISKPLSVTKNGSNFLHSQWISLSLLLKLDEIEFKNHIKTDYIYLYN
jgi:hypothetical protein